MRGLKLWFGSVVPHYKHISFLEICSHCDSSGLVENQISINRMISGHKVSVQQLSKKTVYQVEKKTLLTIHLTELICIAEEELKKNLKKSSKETT